MREGAQRLALTVEPARFAQRPAPAALVAAPAGTWRKEAGGMDWLLRSLGALGRWVVGRVGARRAGRLRAERLYDGAAEREEFLAHARQHGGTYERTIHVVAPRASMDGVAFEEEEIGYDEGDVETKVVVHAWRRCDCGAAIGKTGHLLGTCTICGRVVCTAPGCAARCERCGAVTCRRHSVTHSGRTFCTRHRWLAWWLAYWGAL